MFLLACSSRLQTIESGRPLENHHDVQVSCKLLHQKTPREGAALEPPSILYPLWLIETLYLSLKMV